jgi:hypothetical protein
MNGLRRLLNRIASDRTITPVLSAALIIGGVQLIDPAVAQEANNAPTLPAAALSQPTPVQATPTVAQLPFSAQTQQITATSVGTPFEPPSNPPPVARLPSGAGTLSAGEWLLTPTLGLTSLYNSNLYLTPIPVKGPGLDIRPALTAEYNTGIYDTQLYGSIDSTIYPTLNYQNNTFNRQAGIIQKYSPLPDLIFTAQGDYIHNTLAYALVSSLPVPTSSAGSPPPPGTAGVLSGQQIAVNPNDVYTAQATMYKEFNRAFVKLNGSVATTQYEQQPGLNYQQSTYDGIGGVWLTPQLYAFGDGIQSFADPAVGSTLNTFRARGGFGTSQIGLFQGYIYYGQQGSETNGAGSAGGDIYGGAISYLPTRDLNMSFSVDRLTNISDIALSTLLPVANALAGLPYVPYGFSLAQSLQITDFTFKSNYIFSPETTAYFLGSYATGELIGVGPIHTWFADVGVTHKILDDLSLKLDYRFSSAVSPTPVTNFTQHVVSLGALYRF